MVCIQKRKVLWNFKLYNGNVSSIHKNTKKDRGTKNEFHWRIFCKTLIRQHSCTTHCVQTVPVLAAILQKILWNSIISYLYLFYVFMNTWRHSRIKLRIFKWKGVYVRRYWFSIFVVVDRYLLYSKTLQQIGVYKFHWPSVNESKTYQPIPFNIHNV